MMAEFCGGAAVRVADAVLRTCGGRRVLLRMPMPAVPGSAAEELGLGTPEFQDVALGPVVFRRVGSTKKLLVSASVVKEVVGSLAFDSAEVLFETAAGVVVDGVVYVVEDVVAMKAKAEVYAYCLTL